MYPSPSFSFNTTRPVLNFAFISHYLNMHKTILVALSERDAVSLQNKVSPSHPGDQSHKESMADENDSDSHGAKVFRDESLGPEDASSGREKERGVPCVRRVSFGDGRHARHEEQRSDDVVPAEEDIPHGEDRDNSADPHCERPFETAGVEVGGAESRGTVLEALGEHLAADGAADRLGETVTDTGDDDRDEDKSPGSDLVGPRHVGSVARHDDVAEEDLRGDPEDGHRPVLRTVERGKASVNDPDAGADRVNEDGEGKHGPPVTPPLDNDRLGKVLLEAFSRDEKSHNQRDEVRTEVLHFSGVVDLDIEFLNDSSSNVRDSKHEQRLENLLEPESSILRVRLEE